MSIFDFCGKKQLLVAPAIVFMLGLGANISLAADSFESEVASFANINGDDDIAKDKKRMHFIRITRHFIAKLREQKTAFSRTRGSDKNKVSMEAEETVNMANLLASQGDYDEGVKTIVKAYGVVTTSINEMNVE